MKVGPFALASGFILIGIVVIRSALKSMSVGAAEPGDSDAIYWEAQPVRFSIFVIAQFVFGGIAILAGALLAFAVVLAGQV